MENIVLFGRRRLVSPYTQITADNIIETLSYILEDMESNREEIAYLFRYKRGDQPILYREKTVRPEICNKIVVNRANEIVSFKTGYLLSSPVQYVARNADSDPEDLSEFNSYISIAGKESLDKQIAEDMSTCGVGYRMIIANPKFNGDTEGDEAPFLIYTLNPYSTFVVYSPDVSGKPLMGVIITYRTDEKGFKQLLYTCYTEDHVYTIEDGIIIDYAPNTIGAVPIIEYDNNNDRQGDFEIVLPLLDAINKVESNRLDGVEQFVQSLLLFKNVDISQEDFKELSQLGAIKIKQNGQYEADVKFLNSEMNQTQSQTLANAMYQEVLTIVGMPNRNGGSSTSDTGSAVIMRDGWSDAEARAKTTELVFRRSEKEFIKIALSIYRKKVLGERGHESSLRLKDIDIKFTRKNFENIGLKEQVLVAMLNCEKIAPQLAFEYCGMFSDPATAYKASKAYIDEIKKDTGSNTGSDPVRP